MTFFTLSDIGKVRTNNEDYAESFSFKLCNPDGSFNSTTVMLLCDGMGGGPAGERASFLAVKTMKNCIIQDLLTHESEITNQEYLELFDKYIQKSHFGIYKEGVEDQKLYGMGTTIVAGIIIKDNLLLTHVGDSRGYCFGNNGLRQLTKDHSLVQQYVDEGKITPEEAFYHPQRNIITRVLGAGSGAPVKVDKKDIPLANGDIVMFCTDGLCGVLEEPELTEIFKRYYQQENADLKALANHLIQAACLKGGPDNITVSLYQHKI